MSGKWPLLALVPAFALAVIACDDAPTKPEPLVPGISAGVDDNYWYEGSGSWLDPCTGEVYDYEWKAHYVYYIVEDASGGAHIRGHENGKYKGVGRVTGIKYVGGWIWNLNTELPSSGGWAVNHKYVDRAVSQGPASNTRDIVWNRHWIINANGETTSYWWEPEQIICTG